MSTLQRLVGLGFLIVILIGAGPMKAAESKPSWQAEWKRTVQAAEKEGRLMVYTYGAVDLLFRKAFQRKFPKIKVITVVGRGSQVGQRALSERRAGKYIPDIYVLSATTAMTILYPAKAFEPITPLLILPEVVNPSHW